MVLTATRTRRRRRRKPAHGHRHRGGSRGRHGPRDRYASVFDNVAAKDGDDDKKDRKSVSGESGSYSDSSYNSGSSSSDESSDNESGSGSERSYGGGICGLGGGDDYSSSSESDKKSKKKKKVKKKVKKATDAVKKQDEAPALVVAGSEAPSSLFGSEQTPEEILAGTKVPCKVCGEPRISIKAFDTHVCDRNAVAAFAAQERAPVHVASSVNDVLAPLRVGADEESGDSMSGDASAGDEDMEELRAQLAEMKAMYKAKCAHKKHTEKKPKVVKPTRTADIVEASRGKPETIDGKREVTDSYEAWMAKSKAVFDGAKFAAAVKAGAPYADEFTHVASAGGTPVLVQLTGAMVPARARSQSQIYRISAAVTPLGGVASDSHGIFDFVSSDSEVATHEFNKKGVRALANAHTSIGTETRLAIDTFRKHVINPFVSQ